MKLTTPFTASRRLLLAAALGASLVPSLQGCFPIVATGVAVGVMSAMDRRTVGAQADDEAFEWKAQSLISERIGDKAHVNATSYNRKVLLTGEVPNEEARAQIADITRGITNVAGVYNEVRISPASTLSARGNDSYITSKIKARLVDAKQVSTNHVKVVTEGGVAYLMGIVNDGEAQAAIQTARTTDGVRKVVNLFEVVSQAETRRLDALRQEEKRKSSPAPVEAR